MMRDSFARGSATTWEILGSLRELGYTSQFVPVTGPALLCRDCGHIVSAGRLRMDAQYRLEGASDPDDMVLIVAVGCALCRAKGAVVLGFGPVASAVDADVIRELPQVPGDGLGLLHG